MSDDASEEQWRSVEGYEGFYEVSNQGRVRSLPRTVPLSNGHLRRLKGKVLACSIMASGHVAVDLYRDCVRHSVYVHSLVLETFVGPRPDGLEVLHGDGNPANNVVANLRWGTRRDNSLDTLRHGMNRQAQYEHCPRMHPLAAPNLVASKVRQGHRDCLACARGRAYIAGQSAKGRTGLSLQLVSDAYYSEIVNGAA